MHEVKINNTIVHIPSKWDELNRHYLQLIAGFSSNNYTLTQFKTHLLFYGAGIMVKKTYHQPNPKDRSENLYEVKLGNSSTAHLSPEQVMELGNLFDFLFRTEEMEDGSVKIHLDSHLTLNLIPRFKVSGINYYGPAGKLFNVTLSEYIHAETNLSRYAKTKEIRYLDNLIAILYRPEGKHHQDSEEYSGDRRAPFNDHRFEERAGRISKMTHNLKMCIYLFYQGCQWWYQQQFPHVFKPGTGKADNNLGFLNLVDALTGGDVTKTKEIQQTLLMDVMVHLERSAAEYEKTEEKLRKK